MKHVDKSTYYKNTGKENGRYFVVVTRRTIRKTESPPLLLCVFVSVVPIEKLTKFRCERSGQTLSVNLSLLESKCFVLKN